MFITDLGESLIAENETVHMKIPRYGVWRETERFKPAVVDCSDSLEFLQSEYGPDLPVLKIGGE
jgi:hypothetical protein